MADSKVNEMSGHLLLKHFDAIKIINLKSRKDRRQEMLGELRMIGLDNSARVSFHEASKFDDAGSFPSIGARGCFQSHLSILENAHANGIKSILILEDDLDFSRDIHSQLAAVADHLERNPWSLFYGGALKWDGEPSSVSPVTLSDPAHGVMGTHFIGLRGEAIHAAIVYLRAMLNRPSGSPEGGPMHVDGAYSWFRKAHPEFQTLIAIPALGHQRPSRTDVHSLALQDQIPIIRSVIAFLRKIKRRMK